jgi:hypothetical protein
VWKKEKWMQTKQDDNVQKNEGQNLTEIKGETGGEIEEEKKKERVKKKREMR